MIKANELRKGNLVLLNVNYKDNIHTVDEIYTEEVKVTSIEDGGCFPRMIMKSLRPISLNPEWLEKFGFSYSAPFYAKRPLMLSKNAVRDGAGDYDGFILRVKIEDGMQHMVIRNIHHLQNIFHSLTGEELNVKL